MKLVLITVTLLFANFVYSLPSHSDKILLTDVKALTLYEGKFTTGRRSSPVPQLKCVGGSAFSTKHPSVVQCTNVGTDGIDVQWKCEATLQSGIDLHVESVSCEGYSYPDDPYILKGSCGLTYRLEYSGGTRGSTYHYDDTNYESHSSFGNVVTFIILVVIFLVILNKCFSAPTYPAAQGNYGNGGYYGGPSYPGGGPSSGYPPYYGNGGGGNGGYYGGNGCPPPSSTYPGGGGFWGGMATGGILSYLLNRPSYYGYGYGGYRRGGWGGTSGYSSGSSRSSGSHTSASFGGTSRR